MDRDQARVVFMALTGKALRRPKSAWLSTAALGLAVGLLVALALLTSLGDLRPAAAAGGTPASPLPGICSESDRFGLATTGRQILEYDVSLLHAGWYHNFRIEGGAPRPADMSYLQTIRISEGAGDGTRPCTPPPGSEWKCLTYTYTKAMVDASPGAIWLVGNETDTILNNQDAVTPGRYAEIYDDLYTRLKAWDPTCMVGIAGVVQPTPLRLKYLQMILDAYEMDHGGAQMPIDVWNAHNYVLREKKWYHDCPDCWGAGTPPGLTETQGILYDYWESDLLDSIPGTPKIGWKQQIIDLREFMAENGYADRPLVISEYGILMPKALQYDFARVQAFVLATFDWMRTYTDTLIGYEPDGYRLVQAWGWYPFDIDRFGDPPWDLPAEAHLFTPTLHVLTPLGIAFGDYTDPLSDPFPGTVDLRAITVQHSPPVLGPGGELVVRLVATVDNAGALPSGNAWVRFEVDGQTRDTLLESLEPGQAVSTEIAWQVYVGQTLQVRVSADPDDQITECNPYNNRLEADLWIGDHSIFLPIAGKTALNR